MSGLSPATVSALLKTTSSARLAEPNVNVTSKAANALSILFADLEIPFGTNNPSIAPSDSLNK
jgi:hypothetical protein